MPYVNYSRYRSRRRLGRTNYKSLPYSNDPYTNRKYMKSKQKKRSKASRLTLFKPTIVPDRYFCKLRFVQTLGFQPTVAAPSTRQIWRGNSVYDPDQTGTGLQPSGYDQLSLLYTQYRVYGSKIKVELMPGGASGGNYLHFALYPSTNPSTNISTDHAGEQPYAKTLMLGVNSLSIRTLKNFQSTKRQIGMNAIDQELDLSSPVSSNPIKEWYWVLDYGTIDGLTNIANGYIKATIEYYVEFFDRQLLED